MPIIAQCEDRPHVGERTPLLKREVRLDVATGKRP
jgi:hypothetical protein